MARSWVMSRLDWKPVTIIAADQMPMKMSAAPTGKPSRATIGTRMSGAWAYPVMGTMAPKLTRFSKMKVLIAYTAPDPSSQPNAPLMNREMKPLMANSPLVRNGRPPRLNTRANRIHTA